MKLWSRFPLISHVKLYWQALLPDSNPISWWNHPKVISLRARWWKRFTSIPKSLRLCCTISWHTTLQNSIVMFHHIFLSLVNQLQFQDDWIVSRGVFVRTTAYKHSCIKITMSGRWLGLGLKRLKRLLIQFCHTSVVYSATDTNTSCANSYKSRRSRLVQSQNKWNANAFLIRSVIKYSSQNDRTMSPPRDSFADLSPCRGSWQITHPKLELAQS